MTRKHFQALAFALKNRAPDAEVHHEARLQWAGDVRAIADVCNTQNANFDRSRFYEACGYHV